MSSCCQCEAPERDVAAAEDPKTGEWMRVAFAGLIAAQSMIFGLAVNLSPPEGSARAVLHWALALSAVAVFALVGMPVLRESVRAALRGRIVFDQLFLAGIAGAFGASVHSSLAGVGHVYYEVVAILLAIYTFGRIVGERRRSAALDAARALGREFAACERMRPDGTFERVPSAQIEPGDIVLAPAGSGIPVDGVVVDGTAFVNEASLTGEPFPVVRREGDPVFAGTYAVDGALRVRASAGGGSRRLDAVLERVRHAQATPAAIQREADRLVAWFLPAVIVVSLLTFAGWTASAGWVTGLFNALAVVLVACPCSMGLATPVGIWSAMADLARRGIAAADSDLVERLAKIDTVVFDKTGTLGEEELEIVDLVSAPDASRERMLASVAAVEAASGHPVARAFRFPSAGARAREVSLVPGAGIGGWVDDASGGSHVEVGNSAIVPPAARADADALAAQLRGAGDSTHTVYVLRDGRLEGCAILQERLRSSARAVIAELQAAGLECHVFTGDRAEAAAAHGLPNVEAGLSPEDKAERVRELRRSGSVLFVGDGTNDAPAIAAADASLSLGSGSGLAREAAMGEIVGGDLLAIPHAIARCRQAVRAIRSNLFYAGVYNVAGISLAAAGVLDPVVAALLMLVSSVTVTWRALKKSGGEPVLRSTPPLPRPKLPERRAAAAAIGAGIAAQGPAVVYLGGFAGWVAAGFYGLFFAAGATVYAWLEARRFDRQAGMALGMYSLGGLAMLAGWWADAGFAPVVRDGACFCGCVDSDMGLGLFLQANWMTAGMVAASLPALWIEGRDVPGWLRRGGCWFAGLGGMLVGMEGAALLMAQIPMTAPQAHFFATYAAMATGMVLGMLAACGAWNRLADPLT